MTDLCQSCIYNINELCIKPKSEECPKTEPKFKPLGTTQCYGDYNILSRICFRCSFRYRCEPETTIIEKAIRSLERKKNYLEGN